MSNRFDIIKTPLEGLIIIERKPIGDHRGYFERFFCREELIDLIDNQQIVQINHSRSEKAGTVRGMHFQYPPNAEKKLVSCLKGKIFDVAVDILFIPAPLKEFVKETLKAASEWIVWPWNWFD